MIQPYIIYQHLNQNKWQVTYHDILPYKVGKIFNTSKCYLTSMVQGLMNQKWEVFILFLQVFLYLSIIHIHFN
jgi:hypothetical protein